MANGCELMVTPWAKRSNWAEIHWVQSCKLVALNQRAHVIMAFTHKHVPTRELGTKETGIWTKLCLLTSAAVPLM